jgi:hypothetical protein
MLALVMSSKARGAYFGMLIVDDIDLNQVVNVNRADGRYNALIYVQRERTLKVLCQIMAATQICERDE